VLAALGTRLGGELEPTSLRVPGTESARGFEILHRHFDDSAGFAILLQGPPRAVDRQGPRLVALLRREQGVTTLSPWDRGAGLGGLRPDPGTALILADFHASLREAMDSSIPRLEAILEAGVSAPVRARSASAVAIAKAIQDESVAVTRRGELIVAPLLLVVLLLVFRSPIAAAIPLAFGAMTVISMRGLLALVAGEVGISGFALSIASMIGLALGVDYALLIVSRFRDELRAGRDPAEAATVTRRTAGRTTVFAGGTLFVSILIAIVVVPGSLLFSLCLAVGVAVVLAVLGPWLVAPAILVLLGGRIDRWRLRGGGGKRWLAFSAAALRRPAAAALATGLLLLAIAAPAASLSTGPVTIEQLPTDDPTRLDVEAIEAAVGGGWVAPSIVVAATDHGPITTPGRLAAIDRWQDEVARDPGVETVIGPGRLARRAAPLRRAGNGFLGKEGGSPDLARMAANLGRAGDGLGRLRRGLARASEGAFALTLGSGRAQRGSTLLADGLALASSGGERASRGLEQFSRGAHALAQGQKSAHLGSSVMTFTAEGLSAELSGNALPRARQLERELREAGTGLPVTSEAAAATLEKLQAAWRELGEMGIGASDPRYPALSAAVREALTAASGTDPVTSAPYATGYEGLPRELGGLEDLIGEQAEEASELRGRLSGIRENARLLGTLSRRLSAGIEQLEAGSERLAGGSDRILDGSARLRTGLERLGGGASRLAAGLSRLEGGNAALARGLSTAFRRTAPLASAARRIEVRVDSSRGRLRRTSPGIFDSGYFVLSALDGAPPRSRATAGQLVDLEDGGQAAKVVVVPKHALGDAGADSLNQRLRRQGRKLARQIGGEVAVTGALAQASDYDSATSSRLPLLVIAITVLVFAMMIAILRALPLAALAVALNLLAVAAAFGVLRLLFLVPEGWPLGGSSHIDPVSAAGIFGVVFGLSIDYAVFLLMRMRESWERDGDNDAAIAYGLEHTTGVITGAATVMAIVFSVFATAPIETVTQFGVGLTVAVLLDATVIRLVLLPATMKLAGPRIWWLPAPLARRLPRLDVDSGGIG
jgi:RND superfamily putative drug exporter